MTTDTVDSSKNGETRRDFLQLTAVATAAVRTARLRLAQGRLDEARAEAERARDLRVELLGGANARTAEAWRTVADVRAAAGDTAGAVAALDEALAIWTAAGLPEASGAVAARSDRDVWAH